MPPCYTPPMSPARLLARISLVQICINFLAFTRVFGSGASPLAPPVHLSQNTVELFLHLPPLPVCLVRPLVRCPYHLLGSLELADIVSEFTFLNLPYMRGKQGLDGGQQSGR